MNGRFRWCVIGLIALATVINYIDRNALAVMWPEVSKEIGASKEDYALLVTVFMIFYAGLSIVWGMLGDNMNCTLSGTPPRVVRCTGDAASPLATATTAAAVAPVPQAMVSASTPRS